MKIHTLLTIATLGILPSLSADTLPQDKLLPFPAELSYSPNNLRPFQLTAATALFTNEEDLKSAVDFLRSNLQKGYASAGTGLLLKNINQDKNIILVKKAGKEFREKGDEAYKLSITPERVLIEVNTHKGIFYAGQTLSQLLPDQFYEKDKGTGKWTLPILSIEDYPRFAWRAFMLDECRHFWGEKEVYRLLDQMAQMKMNVFHWHLTDDAGWRIEIKKYPKLTQIGSKRKDSEIGTWGSGKTEGKPHEGFYTQEQIKKIVRYAAQRNITIVPEIEMPGHCSAIVASYPEYGTVKEPIEMPIKFGKLPSALDPTQEKTYKFLSDVLDEVIALFPSKVIHIGGDEVRFEQWNNSEAVKELAKKMGFKNTNTDIQVYFTNKISHMVGKKGRRMMGWNEIMGHDLHGFNVETSTQSLEKNTVIHFWKGSTELAKAAIEKGHDVVNSTHSNTYLDYGYGSISLEKAYNFDPIFQGLPENQQNKVLGLGTQLWTEWISTTDKLHYQAFPRLCAFAEVGWTPKSIKNFSSFKNRLKTHSKRMDAAGIKYATNVVSEITESDFFNAAKLGMWAPQNLDGTEAEWDISSSLKSEGTYKISFFYNKGANAIEISKVALLVDGKEVAKDAHAGHSGKEKRDITYTLKVPAYTPGSKITLKASMRGAGGRDSHGTIYMEKE